MKKNLYLDATIFVLLAMALTWPVRAGEMTAFQLIKEGNRYVGEESKNQVVQIRSEKSVVGMVPNIWYVVYYDPDATFHATEVKFGAGKKMGSEAPDADAGARQHGRKTGDSEKVESWTRTRRFRLHFRTRF